MFVIILALIILILVFLIIFFYIIIFNINFYLEWTIFNYNLLSWDLRIKLDYISTLFSFIVCIISLRIFIYSLRYIDHRKEKVYFFFILFFFVLSIIIFILSFNITSILLGWDGLGITSFLLVCYYHSKKSINSSLITFFVNRVGDLLIIIRINIFIFTHSWNLRFTNDKVFIWSIFLIIASFRKRAQIPFSNWLPKAMAAPTPVSSLVHSSTLVTAGVYLIFRLPVRFWINRLNWVFYLSSFTLLIRSLLAISSFDLKEIVAFSTLRHVRFIIITLSCKLHVRSFFHLCTHAIFKALLFICSGYLIYLLSSQDIRKLGILNFNIIIKIRFTISVLSIIGLFFLAGFFSKDFIIEEMYNLNLSKNLIFYISVIATSSYSIRLIIYINIMKNFSIQVFKSSDYIKHGIIILSFFSLIVGSLLQWNLFPLRFFIIRSYNKILIYFFLILGLFYSVIKIEKYLNLIFNSFLYKIYYINFFLLKNKKVYFLIEKGWRINIFNFFLFKSLSFNFSNQKTIIILILLILIFFL